MRFIARPIGLGLGNKLTAVCGFELYTEPSGLLLMEHPTCMITIAILRSFFFRKQIPLEPAPADVAVVIHQDIRQSNVEWIAELVDAGCVGDG